MKKKSSLTLLLAVAFFVLTKPAFSQLPANWTKLPSGTENTLIDIASLNSDTLFTIDEEGNISATFDAGKIWSGRNPQTGKEIKFNALHINSALQTIIAVGDSNAIYRTSDWGKNWESTYSGSADAAGSAGAPVSLYAIDEGCDDDKDGDGSFCPVIYVVGEKGTILKSTNDGVDWKKMELNIGANQDLKFVSFFNADTGFVANENGIIRTFDGGNSWKAVSTDSGTRALRTRGKFKAGKALADVVKSIDNNGGGIQTSTDYGATWTKDNLGTPCDLLASGGVVFDKTQCEDLYNGQLARGGGGGAGKVKFFMLSGNTFKGVLQPKWEGVDLENVLMVMQTVGEQAIIAEAVTDSKGRFDLDIPLSFSGNVEITAKQAWDPDWCPAPLPADETTLEPMEECDESRIQLQVISPAPVELNDLTFNDNGWIAVGDEGVILRSTYPTDSDSDGFPDIWIKENSKTNENLLAAAAARGIEKTDIWRGFVAAGKKGTIAATLYSKLKIILPSGNDSLCSGSEVTIHWSGGDPSWNLGIYIIDVNAWASVAIVNPNTINDGNETWNIPSNFPPGVYEIYIEEVNLKTWIYGNDFIVKNCPNQPICLLECENNILQNPGFTSNAVYGPMPIGSTANWNLSWYKAVQINNEYLGITPDVSKLTCETDTVLIGMWGNKAIGESIEQMLNVPFVQGKTYSVSFIAQWAPSFNRPYPVQFEFRASTVPLTSPGDGVLIGISNPLTTPGHWTTITIPDWVAPNSTSITGTFPVLTVSATNQSSALHPDSTSYGQISSICITEKTTTNANFVQLNPESGFKLGQSYPNPFSKTTVIEYALPKTEHVTIKVYDIFGKEIKTLVDGVKIGGEH